jgi:hypothetical protein
VQVGNALADPIVNRHERAFCQERGFESRTQHLGIANQPRAIRRRKLRQSLYVAFGNQQAMAREERAVIQKGEKALVLEDDGGRVFSVDNAAKRAVHGSGATFHPMLLCVENTMLEEF